MLSPFYLIRARAESHRARRNQITTTTSVVVLHDRATVAPVAMWTIVSSTSLVTIAQSLENEVSEQHQPKAD